MTILPSKIVAHSELNVGNSQPEPYMLLSWGQEAVAASTAASTAAMGQGSTCRPEVTMLALQCL